MYTIKVNKLVSQVGTISCHFHCDRNSPVVPNRWGNLDTAVAEL